MCITNIKMCKVQWAHVWSSASSDAFQVLSPAAEPRLLGHRSGQLPPSAGGVVQHLGQSVQDFFAHVPDHHVRLPRLLLYRHQQTQQKSTGDIKRWNSSRRTCPPVQGGFSSGCGGLIVGWVPLSVAHTAGSVTGCSSSRVSPFMFVWGAHTRESETTRCLQNKTEQRRSPPLPPLKCPSRWKRQVWTHRLFPVGQRIEWPMRKEMLYITHGDIVLFPTLSTSLFSVPQICHL